MLDLEIYVDGFSIIFRSTALLYIEAHKIQPEGSWENVSDDELVRQIRLGDDGAAEELIRRYYAAVMRYCRWHCSSAEIAEDLTQETFLRLFRSLPEYRGRKKFKAYLYTIANHLCIDESRKVQPVPLEDGENIASECGELHQVEDREEVRQLLDRLSPEQREVIILRYGEQLSFAEIAKIMESNVRTVQSRVRYALQIMRKASYD